MTSFEHNLSFSGECFLVGASSHILSPTIHPYPVSTVSQDKPGLEPAQKVRERITRVNTRQHAQHSPAAQTSPSPGFRRLGAVFKKMFLFSEQGGPGPGGSGRGSTYRGIKTLCHAGCGQCTRSSFFCANRHVLADETN